MASYFLSCTFSILTLQTHPKPEKCAMPRQDTISYFMFFRWLIYVLECLGWGNHKDSSQPSLSVLFYRKGCCCPLSSWPWAAQPSLAYECAVVAGECPLSLSYKTHIKNITAAISLTSEHEHNDMDNSPNLPKQKQTSKQAKIRVWGHFMFGTINAHPTLSGSSMPNSWHFTISGFSVWIIVSCL